MLASFEQALNIECDESNYGQFPLLGLLNTTTDHDTLQIVLHYSITCLKSMLVVVFNVKLVFHISEDRPEIIVFLFVHHTYIYLLCLMPNIF